MPLVDSLLTAVVRSDGDALVLHVGEKPYVVAASGPVELSRQGLGLGAMEGMLAQLLSADALRSLREMGAVEHELDDRPASSGDRFTVVAARGGDDIWIELRRHRRLRGAAPAEVESTLPPPVAAAPPVVAEPAASTVEAPTPAPAPIPSPMHVPTTGIAMPAVDEPETGVVELPADMADATPVDAVEPPVELAAPPAMSPVPMPDFAPLPQLEGPVATVALTAPEAGKPAVPAPPVADLPPDLDLRLAPATQAVEAVQEPVSTVPVVTAQAPNPPDAPPPARVVHEPVFDDYADLALPPPPARLQDRLAPPVALPPPARLQDLPAPPVVLPPPAPMLPPAALPPPAPAVAAAEPRVAYRHEPAPPQAPLSVRHSAPPPVRYEAPSPESVHFASPEPQPTLPGLAASGFGGDHPLDGARLDGPDAVPAVVLSLTRDSARSSGGAARGATRPGGIERLLRLASARGASALYLTTQARPAVRVDGDIRLLDGEPALSSGDVEAAVLELAPEGARDKESAEWIRDLADVGRVRITTFRDYRGPGALLRMISAKATSAEQLGLVREIQALAMEPEGLVIVTGPRASGKSTLVSAYVDLINRQRNDYVITLEGQIRLVHESRGSLISQREVRGSASDIVTAARMALRENPDVLVIEDLRSPDVLQAALDAAGSGLLVFVSVTAASATAALERLVDLCPSEQRRNVRAALAEHLRGVVAQVLLRKAGGGRLAARELVLNTNAVAALVSDGQIAQLPRAIDSGRKLGMAPLNDALVAFVQSGAVDVREAYRKADDKVGLLALLRREGIDTSFVERLA